MTVPNLAISMIVQANHR